MNKFFFICFIIFLINNENVGAAPSFGLGTSQSYRDAEERNNLKRKNQRNDFYEALNSYLNFCLELSEKDIILRSIEEKGAVKRWYEELMAFREEVNNERVITLNYDKLVFGDEEEIRRLLGFCGSSIDVDLIKNWFAASFEKSQSDEIRSTNRSGDSLFFRKGANSNGSELFDEKIMEELEKSVNY